MNASTKAPTDRLTFSDDDLAHLEALRASHAAARWRFHLDYDDDHDLIAAQPPYAPEAVFLITPRAAGGVLMAAKGTGELAFVSLREALRPVVL
jgi:hypothetical protein